MNFFDVNQNLHDTSIDIILNITWTNQYLLTSLTKDIHINIACERQTFLLAHRHEGRFARRNLCDSTTEIPYWWRKICPESSQKS